MTPQPGRSLINKTHAHARIFILCQGQIPAWWMEIMFHCLFTFSSWSKSRDWLLAGSSGGFFTPWSKRSFGWHRALIMEGRWWGCSLWIIIKFILMNVSCCIQHHTHHIFSFSYLKNLGTTSTPFYIWFSIVLEWLYNGEILIIGLNIVVESWDWKISSDFYKDHW